MPTFFNKYYVNSYLINLFGPYLLDFVWGWGRGRGHYSFSTDCTLMNAIFVDV